MRQFSDHTSAGRWLLQFKSDRIAMANLRALAASSGNVGTSLGRTNDEQVLETLSWLLSRGVLHVHKVPAPATAWRTAQQSSTTEPARPASRPTSPSQRTTQAQQDSSTPKPADEADTFSARTDGAATAAVLRGAAASGVPFCEECAKAAAGKQAAS